MRRDHSSFVLCRKRYCLLPRKNDVQNQCVWHHAENTLSPNSRARDRFFVKDPLSVGANPNFAICLIYLHLNRMRDFFEKVLYFAALPRRLIAELGEAEAGSGFAFAGEKLLHQPFLMSLERPHFPPLRGNQLIQRRQTVGDLLLLSGRGNCDGYLF